MGHRCGRRSQSNERGAVKDQQWERWFYEFECAVLEDETRVISERALFASNWR